MKRGSLGTNGNVTVILLLSRAIRDLSLAKVNSNMTRPGPKSKAAVAIPRS